MSKQKTFKIIERKLSVRSTSSIDSGISVQRDIEKDDTWSVSSASSSSSSSTSTSIQITENPGLSDYETEEESSEIIDINYNKDDTASIFSENKSKIFSVKDLHMFGYGSQLDFRLSSEQFSSLDRETAV